MVKFSIQYLRVTGLGSRLGLNVTSEYDIEMQIWYVIILFVWYEAVIYFWRTIYFKMTRNDYTCNGADVKHVFNRIIVSNSINDQSLNSGSH